jgi:hypothetical protein
VATAMKKYSEKELLMECIQTKNRKDFEGAEILQVSLDFYYVFPETKVSLYFICDV